MRVLLLNYEYPPLGGGAGVATAALAQGLAVRGVAVDVVTARDDRSDPPETEFAGLKLHPVFTKRKGVHQAGIAGAYSYLLGAVPIVRRLLHSNRYDAVHVFFSLPTGALIPLVGLTAEPVVVSLRGSDVPGYDRSKPKLQRAHRALLPLTRWIWRRADRVVAVCDSLRKLARETEPDLRVDVVPNGVDLDLFRPAPEPRPARRGPVRCIAVARLIQRKGLADLLRACSLLERGSFRLEIVGDGPSEDLLRSLAGELGVGGDVHFAGALERTALAERYREADLFTLVPFDEAFGTVFAEALASDPADRRERHRRNPGAGDGGRERLSGSRR
ncbi:MAG: glycosyltransferase [Longimicrobiaceae bacterium]